MSEENCNNGKYNIKQIVPVLLAATMAMGACSSAKQEAEPVKKLVEKAVDKQVINVVPAKAIKPTKELIKMIKKPTNPTELLKNLKYAIDNDLLIREVFYTESNLKKMYGGDRVVWKRNQPFNKEAEIQDLDNLFENAKMFPKMGIDVSWNKLDTQKNVNENGKIHGSGRIGPYVDSRFTAEAIEAVFGSKLQVVNPYEKHTHPTGLTPGSHKYGNKMLIYIFESPISKTKITFLIEGDGTVNRCNFSQEVK